MVGQTVIVHCQSYLASLHIRKAQLTSLGPHCDHSATISDPTPGTLSQKRLP